MTTGRNGASRAVAAASSSDITDSSGSLNKPVQQAVTVTETANQKVKSNRAKEEIIF